MRAKLLQFDGGCEGDCGYCGLQEVAHVRLLTLPYRLSGLGAACYSSPSSGVLSES